MDKPDVTFRRVAVAYLAEVVGWRTVVERAATLMAKEAPVPESVVDIASADSEPRRRDAEALVRRALSELALSAPQPGELSTMRAETTLRAIADGHVGPVEGANRLWAGRESDGDPFGVLPDLIQLVDSWESRLDERRQIEKEIVQVSRSALARS